uniref:DUF7477 domain-containing protein n=1 Tax=Zea mays TaxID=4577 RepID=A0A804NA19_MAIZE
MRCDELLLLSFVINICCLFLRYHYNVADSRLRQHIEKGNDDELYISSVASSANLWALIMDAGTGFCSQVYELSPVFLHKDWIMEQWEKSYYITAIAGSSNESSLVVMSKGLDLTFSCHCSCLHIDLPFPHYFPVSSAKSYCFSCMS